jgi:hypothetical protein
MFLTGIIPGQQEYESVPANQSQIRLLSQFLDNTLR